MAFRDGEGVCTKLRLCMYLLTLRLNKRPYFTGYVYPFSKCRYQTVVATMYALRLSEYSCIYVNADVEEQAFGTVTVSSWRGLVKWAWLSSVGLVVASISKPRKPGRMVFFLLPLKMLLGVTPAAISQTAGIPAHIYRIQTCLMVYCSKNLVVWRLSTLWLQELMLWVVRTMYPGYSLTPNVHLTNCQNYTNVS